MYNDPGHSFFNVDEELMLISHAGDISGGAAPGTLSAYRLAHAAGCRGFQVDVVAAADNELMSMHTIFGRQRSLEHGTIDEARRRAGADIPTLVDLMKLFPDARWNIEMKSARCEPALTDLLTRLPETDRICISAPFHSRVLRRLRTTFPSIATNASLLEGGLVGINLLPWRRDRASGVQLIRQLAFRPVVRHNIKRGRVVHVWTVNSGDLALALHARGVRGVIVDDYVEVATAAATLN